MKNIRIVGIKSNFYILDFINNFIFTFQMHGVIKKLTDKNYGFISQEGADDLFFHANSLEDVDFDQLNEGDEVTFEVEQTEKGKAAVNVKKA